jgi:hypothetical protein
MNGIQPILLAEEHIHFVAATNKINSIGRWDIITDNAHRLSIIKTIEENLDNWL